LFLIKDASSTSFSAYCLGERSIPAYKLQYIVSKSRYHVLRLYKNNNRKRSFSNACGCFEMVEATGVEPVS